MLVLWLSTSQALLPAYFNASAGNLLFGRAVSCLVLLPFVFLLLSLAVGAIVSWLALLRNKELRVTWRVYNLMCLKFFAIFIQILHLLSRAWLLLIIGVLHKVIYHRVLVHVALLLWLLVQVLRFDYIRTRVWLVEIANSCFKDLGHSLVDRPNIVEAGSLVFDMPYSHIFFFSRTEVALYKLDIVHCCWLWMELRTYHLVRTISSPLVMFHLLHHKSGVHSSFVLRLRANDWRVLVCVENTVSVLLLVLQMWRRNKGSFVPLRSVWSKVAWTLLVHLRTEAVCLDRLLSVSKLSVSTTECIPARNLIDCVPGWVIIELLVKRTWGDSFEPKALSSIFVKNPLQAIN